MNCTPVFTTAYLEHPPGFEPWRMAEATAYARAGGAPGFEPWRIGPNAPPAATAYPPGFEPWRMAPTVPPGFESMEGLRLRAIAHAAGQPLAARPAPISRLTDFKKIILG